MGFKVIQCAGNGGFILLAAFAKLCCGQPACRIQVIQAGDVCTPQIIFCHLLILDLADVAADPVDEHGKGFKPFLHGRTSKFC